jgi:hypothetical protein
VLSLVHGPDSAWADSDLLAIPLVTASTCPICCEILGFNVAPCEIAIK